MPTPTYTPLATITLSSAASTVTFSGISQAYADIVITSSATTTADTYFILRPNPSTSSNNYVQIFSRGDYGISYQYGQNLAGLEANPNSTGNTYRSSSVSTIFDYAKTDKHKPITMRHSQPRTNGYVNLIGGRFATTSAVTSVALVCSGSTFTAGSTFSLFGIIS